MSSEINRSGNDIAAPNSASLGAPTCNYVACIEMRADRLDLRKAVPFFLAAAEQVQASEAPFSAQATDRSGTGILRAAIRPNTVIRSFRRFLSAAVPRSRQKARMRWFAGGFETTSAAYWKVAKRDQSTRICAIYSRLESYSPA